VTPDSSQESRLLRVERELAALKQEVTDLSREVLSLSPLTVAVARVEGQIGNLVREVKDIQDQLDTRDQRASDERRSLKVALISLTGVIGAALIGGIAAVIAAGVPG
jgi:seryl-tRNA synthetase